MKYNKKGQSILLSHALLVSFTIILIFAIFTTLNGMKNDFRDFTVKKEIQNGCNIIRQAVEKIYVNSNYRSPQNFTAGVAVVYMPDKMGGVPYRITFSGHKITLDASPVFNTTCNAGFNASYLGSSNGGLMQVRFIKYANGTDSIELNNI